MSASFHTILSRRWLRDIQMKVEQEHTNVYNHFFFNPIGPIGAFPIAADGYQQDFLEI